jgi:hypothetical protein
LVVPYLTQALTAEPSYSVAVSGASNECSLPGLIIVHARQVSIEQSAVGGSISVVAALALAGILIVAISAHTVSHLTAVGGDGRDTGRGELAGAVVAELCGLAALAGLAEVGNSARAVAHGHAHRHGQVAEARALGEVRGLVAARRVDAVVVVVAAEAQDVDLPRTEAFRTTQARTAVLVVTADAVQRTTDAQLRCAVVRETVRVRCAGLARVAQTSGTGTWRRAFARWQVT